MTPARLVAVAATTHHNAAFGRVSAVNIEAPSERLTRTAQGLATVNGGANLSASQVPKVRRLWRGMDSNFWYRGTKAVDFRSIPGSHSREKPSFSRKALSTG